MKIKISNLNPAIEGKALAVKKTTRILAELQRQTGWNMAQMTEAEAAVYGAAIAAFCALQNAGFEPKWDDVLDLDTDDFELVEEPGDNRPEADAVDPPQPRADSDPGGAAPAAQSAAG